MKIAAVLLATVGLACAGVASASTHVSDVDYLRANRCKGLAMGLGADTASLDALIKTEGRSRAESIVLRAQNELDRGKREAAKSDLKERLTAELNGPCEAYMTAGKEASGGH